MNDSTPSLERIPLRRQQTIRLSKNTSPQVFLQVLQLQRAREKALDTTTAHNSSWWPWSRASSAHDLSLEKAKEAVGHASFVHKVNLLNRMADESGSRRMQQVPAETIAARVAADVVVSQLQTQLERLERVQKHRTTGLSKKTMRLLTVETFHKDPTSVMAAIEEMLASDRKFAKQRCFKQVRRLMQRLHKDCTSKQEQVVEICCELAGYLEQRHRLASDVAQIIAHHFVAPRIGILSRPTTNNQDS